MSECKCECKCKSAQLKVVKTYHDNDKLFQEYTVNDQGQKHGTYREWYYNGQLLEQSEYVNGKSYGIRYVWYIDGYLSYIEQCHTGNLLVEVIFRQDNQRLKKPILTITEPNHAKVGDGLIQVIKVLQEKGIKFKIAKIGDK